MAPVVYILFVWLASLFGGWLPLVRRWSKSHLALALSFTAGVLLGASFLHMVPEITAELGSSAGAPLILGFFLIFTLESFFLVHPCDEEDCENHDLGVAAFFGITFHSLLDGLALGASFALEHPTLQRAVFLAVAFHKVPAAAGLGTMLLVGNGSRRRAAWLVAAYSLATPLGAVVTYGLVDALPATVLAWGIGLSAGTFVAIATSDLIPQVHSLRGRGVATIASMATGVAVMWVGRILDVGVH